MFNIIKLVVFAIAASSAASVCGQAQPLKSHPPADTGSPAGYVPRIALMKFRSTFSAVSDISRIAAELPIPLAGEVTYMADAARFKECHSGRSYPIAQEGDFANLQGAYREAAPQPGAPVFMTLDGVIVDRHKIDGEGAELTIVVQRFINAWPQEKCERAMADASLTNTYWRIVKLENERLEVSQNQREPHLILRLPGEPRFSATVGCNQISGSYNVSGNTISFGKDAASTMMACVPPLENRCWSSLARRVGAGNTLEFFDGSGSSLALFEAVYLY